MSFPDELAHKCAPLVLGNAIAGLFRVSKALQTLQSNSLPLKRSVEVVQTAIESYLDDYSQFADQAVDWVESPEQKDVLSFFVLTPLIVASDLRKQRLPIDWTTFTHYYLTDARRRNNAKRAVPAQPQHVAASANEPRNARPPTPAGSQPSPSENKRKTHLVPTRPAKRRSSGQGKAIVNVSDGDDRAQTNPKKSPPTEPLPPPSLTSQAKEPIYPTPSNMKVNHKNASDLEDMYWPPQTQLSPILQRPGVSASERPSQPNRVDNTKVDSRFLLPTPTPSSSETIMPSASQEPSRRRDPSTLAPGRADRGSHAIEDARKSDSPSPLGLSVLALRRRRVPSSSPEAPPAKTRRIHRRDALQSSPPSHHAQSVDGSSEAAPSSGSESDGDELRGSSQLQKNIYSVTHYPFMFTGVQRCHACIKADEDACKKRRADGACSYCSSRRTKCSTCTKIEHRSTGTPMKATKPGIKKGVPGTKQRKKKQEREGLGVQIAHPRPRASQDTRTLGPKVVKAEATNVGLGTSQSSRASGSGGHTLYHAQTLVASTSNHS